ncbi:hypothetical protein [Clostridium acidisoli]|uniref:hypothetical protein n=1 Tax=Clostridium acidisoli TaxID=91624 RepID=UPI0015949507|nr:hypothetical protein [Clostridium acidisoli]
MDVEVTLGQTAEHGVNKPNINAPYIGFQYSQTGKIPGIIVTVDGKIGINTLKAILKQS